ncbi:MAG: hypothetical protein IKY23_03490 [Lachnospiraceae bacterium]|nr:hypothetical protein [Lachnospiraceae bacterium]
MKKSVINKRKKLRVFGKKEKRKKQMLKAAVWGLAALLLSPALQVFAQESADTLFTKEVSVYHEHKGNETDGGLCYNLPVYHVHEGDETGGGACYQIPVYHVHTGDDISGGPCYQTPVFHAHDGHEGMAGVCYTAVYHTHKSTCYEEKKSSEAGCYILRYEDTYYDDYEGYDFKDYYMACGIVVHGTNSSHVHKELVCKREGKIDKYKLTCTMTSSTIVGYQFDCPKTEETIDSYALSCTKSSDYIEKYERSCGRSEEIPVATVEISACLAADKESVTMYAKFADRSEGEIFTSQPPFVWYDGSGNQIGTGESLKVTTNGTYFVELLAENEDIRKNNLKTKLEISAILKKEKPTAAPTAKPTKAPAEDDGTGKSTPAPGITEEPLVTPIPVPVETKAPKETADPNEKETPKAVILSEDSGPSAKPQTAAKTSLPIMKVAPLYGEASDRQTPTPRPVMKQETVEKKTEMKQSAPEPVKTEPVTMKKQAGAHFFAKPVVKVVTITASTVLGFFCLLFLCWCWRFGIMILNDDGKGTMQFLGLCILKRREEGYLLTIPGRMMEKAVTNRYCLRSMGFHLWRKEEEELIILAGKQKRTVKIRKEMQVVL